MCITPNCLRQFGNVYCEILWIIGLRFCQPYHPLVLNGGSLGTSIMFHPNNIADYSKINLSQVDIFATWVYMFQELTYPEMAHT